jgi:hypothetical protein
MDYALYTITAPIAPNTSKGVTAFHADVGSIPSDDDMLGSASRAPSNCNTALTFWLGMEAIEPREPYVAKQYPEPDYVLIAYEYPPLFPVKPAPASRLRTNKAWHVENVPQRHLWKADGSETNTAFTFWLGAEAVPIDAP